MFYVVNNLCVVNMFECDVVGWWKVLCWKCVQCVNINVMYGVIFIGFYGC